MPPKTYCKTGENKMENQRQDFILFTDTDTDITKERADALGYHLISMPYNVDGKEVYPYVDFKTFDEKAFYDQLRKGAMPKTSALSPADYENYFEPFLKDGKDVLYVHFSKAMSGTFGAMNIALKSLKEKYPNNTVYTIDTKGITLGAYNIVLEIGDLYNKGKTIAEIMKWAEKEVDKFATFFFANDLNFFRRSGRVKALTAMMGNMFGIRPIITMGSDGIMASIDKARGLNSTLDKIMEYVNNLQEDIGKHRVIIGHTDALETAKLLEEKLKEKYGDKLNIEYAVTNPTAGSHCGPDGVGINFHAIHR